MGLREIRHRLGNLNWLRLLGASASVSEPHQVFECGSDAAAGDHARRKLPERWLEVRHAANGHAAPSPARKIDIPARSSGSTARSVSPADIVRRILDGTAGVTISNVLVVGTDGSNPVKRIKIDFDDPRQVPGAFSSLATALENNGADFNILQNLSIPATEIWLTYPLDDRKETVLSCATVA